MGAIPDYLHTSSRTRGTLKRNPLKSYIIKRVMKQNRNYLVAFVGETGSGKSYAAIEFALQLDPTFTIERIVFSVQEFMALINSGLPSGSVILFDEVGVSMDSRQWYSMINKMMNYVLQTFRHRNLICIFTVPLMKFVDSNARNLMHAYVIMRGVKKSENMAYGSYYMISMNYRTNQVFTKKPRIVSGKEEIRIDYVRFKKPPKAFLAKYEEKRGAFTTQLNEGIEKELGVITRKSEKPNQEQMVEYVTHHVGEFRRMIGGAPRISAMIIAGKWGIGKDKAYFISQICENIIGPAGLMAGGDAPLVEQALPAQEKASRGGAEPDRPEALPGDSGPEVMHPVDAEYKAAVKRGRGRPKKESNRPPDEAEYEAAMKPKD